MSVTTSQREQAVTAAIREISHIATLPEITMQIIELVEDSKSTATDLQKVISNDPALCSRILKVVNSSFYGLPGQIGSINRAIVMLGLNAVKNIAIAASLAKLFRGGELTPGFSARDLWQHSNATAVAAKLLGDELRLGLGDEAYLAGLIHDIGLMVEMQYDRSRLIDVVESVPTDPTGAPTVDFRRAELDQFGATHEDFGRGLCDKWKFPISFEAATGFHHDPMQAPDAHRKLAALVCAADRMAAASGKGFRLDIQDTSIPEPVMDLLGMTAETIAKVTPKFQEALANLDSSLA